jgi:hypothetical protein
MATKPEQQFPEKFYRDPVGLDRYVVQEKVLFEWTAPNKIEKTRQKTEVAQYILGIVIIALIFLLLNDLILSLVFIAGAFMWLVMLLSKPSFLRCQITTIGIKVEDQYYYWPQLTQFWFENRSETKILYLRNLISNINYVKLIILSEDEEKIKNTIGKYLLYKKPRQNMYEKTLEKIIDKLPFRLDFI